MVNKDIYCYTKIIIIASFFHVFFIVLTIIVLKAETFANEA